MDARTQRFRIGHYLANGGQLTPMDALERFGCFRLGARIYDLRKDGWKIKRQLVRKAGKRVALYYL